MFLVRGRRGHRHTVTAPFLMVTLAVRVAIADDIPIHFESTALVAQVKMFLRDRAKDVRAWARAPEVLAAVRSQNTSPLSDAEIQEIDKRWQVGTHTVARGRDVLEGGCANTLRRLIQSKPAGYYREAFVADARGALVCATERTSDYWQGDESKWVRAFNKGRGAIYIGPVQYDESVALPLVQISVPILDDEHRAVGVLIVGKTVHSVQVGRALERRTVID